MSENPILEHPDDALTASYLDGNLQGESRDRFEAHLAQCQVCRDGVVLLRSTEVEEPEVPEQLMRRARAARNRSPGAPRWLLGMAASLLLMAAITAGVLRLGSGGQRTASPVRGDHPGLADLSPSGSTLIPADRVIFHWSPVVGADRYELSVYDAEGRKVAQATLGPQEHSSPWPAEAPPASAGSYLWKIRAMALDRALAESEMIPFEVGP